MRSWQKNAHPTNQMGENLFVLRKLLGDSYAPRNQFCDAFGID